MIAIASYAPALHQTCFCLIVPIACIYIKTTCAIKTVLTPAIFHQAKWCVFTLLHTMAKQIKQVTYFSVYSGISTNCQSQAHEAHQGGR